MTTYAQRFLGLIQQSTCTARAEEVKQDRRAYIEATHVVENWRQGGHQMPSKKALDWMDDHSA